VGEGNRKGLVAKKALPRQLLSLVFPGSCQPGISKKQNNNKKNTPLAEPRKLAISQRIFSSNEGKAQRDINRTRWPRNESVYRA
jgi:hypothetical protein